MATESIGALIPTAIPGYADAADIQAALRAYHYGSYSYNPANTSPGSLVDPSMAKTIYDIQQDIITLENRPSSGGDVATTAPQPGDFTPSGIPNGYIWVDQDGTIGGQPISATAVFTASAPTSNLSTGVIWVDQDPASITDNPFIATALIDAKGDLIAGGGNDSAVRLAVASTNGWVLNVNSATSSGLAWVDSAASTQTLTNKTINLTSNTLSGTVAQFNTALSDGDFATLAGSETLSNKTLTAPRFADLGFIADANGNELIIMDTVASAVNEITIANAATGSAPTITASGETNVSLNLVPKGTGSVQVGGVPVVTTSGTQTLTNKTLTSPIISSISNTGTLTLPTSTDTLVGRATSDTLTNKTINGANNTLTVRIANDVSGLGTGVATFLATPSSANLAAALTDETGSGAAVFGTSPTITTAVLNQPVMVSPEERINVVASAATGTVALDALTAGTMLYTSNATGNWTLNVRGSASTSLNSILTTNDSITVVFLNTNGTTAYYPTAFQIDGSAVTPKWQGGTAPSAGNASSIDAYVYNIIKTASATYTVLASQTKFA